MGREGAADVDAAGEIALAAGVPEDEVRAALAHTGASGYATHADAVRIGRALAARAGVATSRGRTPASLFTVFSASTARQRANGVPLILSSTLHVVLIAVTMFMTTFGLTPHAATTRVVGHADPMHLVFLAPPG